MSQPLLRASHLRVDAPGGRALFRDLNISLARENVAIVGRNGVGKSCLLEVLAGQQTAQSGEVSFRSQPLLVRQNLDPMAVFTAIEQLAARAGDALQRELHAAGLPLWSALPDPHHWSRGELRKLALVAAKLAHPQVLLLDEPTQDLDSHGVSWLSQWLLPWRGAALVVSHNRQLLDGFQHFFIVAESGCRHVAGQFGQLEAELERDRMDAQKRYVRNLNILVERERHNETVCRRRRRKKNVGRITELRRGPSRERLNENRSYAQESQGKRAVVRKQRIDAVRQWAKATRRALAVSLPLKALAPRLDDDDGHDNIVLDNVSAKVHGRNLFAKLDLRVRRDRVAVVGANGTGKTTLLNTMLGRITPTAGTVSVRSAKIGAISQGATDWMLGESLLSELHRTSSVASTDALAQLLVAHRFPLALAERPFASLSPGERVRAALICLFQRAAAVEVLVLDEPTYSLDFVGAAALRAVLQAWPGGLVVATHDRDFLAAIGIDHVVDLDSR